MTLRFLLSTILDSSYGFVIDGLHYISGDHIPSDYLDRVVRRVVPRNGKLESSYLIKFENRGK